MANKNAYMHITLPSNKTVKNDGSTIAISIDFRETNSPYSNIITDITSISIPISFVNPFGRVYDIYDVFVLNGSIASFNFTATTNHEPQVVYINENYIDPIKTATNIYDVQIVESPHIRFFVYSN